MLKKDAQPERLFNNKLAYISLTLVGLMWVFPFLHYRHENPLTTFDQEWWSAMLGVLALTLLVARNYWQQAEIPRIAQFPMALIVIVLVQMLLNKLAYFEQGLLYIFYMLLAALLMLLGARLRTCIGIEKMAVFLAVALLAGAELSALLGVLQQYKIHTPLDSVVVMKFENSGVYGNLAQPNHFANYIALGLISLGLLFQQRKLNHGAVIFLALPLLFVLTLSGSRSSWLYLLLMTGLSGWFAWRDAALRPLLRYSLLLIAGFGLMHLLAQLTFMVGADSKSTDTVQHLLAVNGGGDTRGHIRLYLWREAGLMFMQSPLLGVGFGQFAWNHFQLLPILKGSNIVGLYNNAHNLIFQLAAEAGLAGIAALFASFGVWFYGIRREAPSASNWWGYAALGVLAIHSLLEYPLWYSYFVGIAAILLGAYDKTHYRLQLRRTGRIMMLMMLILGLISLTQLHSGYQQLKETLAMRITSDYEFQRFKKGLVAVQKGGSLLTPNVDMSFLALANVDADFIKEKIELGAKVTRYAPVAQAVYRQAYLLAQDGQLEPAKQLLEQAIWSYPDNSEARRQLQNLVDKDTAHFSALLEFAIQKEQEHARAIHQ